MRLQISKGLWHDWALSDDCRFCKSCFFNSRGQDCNDSSEGKIQRVTMINRTPLARELLRWWKANARTFPWRSVRDPYLILIAEVLLHRTRASQVSRVYQDFVQTYPTIQSLALAESPELLAILGPLGLTWRVYLLKTMAEQIVKEHGGRIPQSVDELKSLPGLGDYIASAVASFAFGYHEPILDTNTVRIVSRLSNIPLTDGSRRSKKFRDAYQAMMSPKYPREFNLAMLDLGALVCLRVHPRCNICPIMSFCSYGLSRLSQSSEMEQLMPADPQEIKMSRRLTKYG